MKITDSETLWAKIGNISQVSFVGKDVLFFGSGCHLTFINLLNGEELLYTANNYKTGDGISCYVGHRTQNVFAFAEKRTKATIFVKTYPSFEEIFNVRDECSEGYIALAFSESSALIALGHLPNFNLTVWNWRLGEKIASQEGGILMTNQILKCNLGSPVFFAQLGVESKLLDVWDVYICGKKCILTQHNTIIEGECEDFTSILWTSEGGLFVLTTKGSVYTMLPDHNLEKVIDFTEPGNYATSFAWYKSGIVVSGPNNEIRHYKKSGSWSVDWAMVPPEPPNLVIARFEHLVTITENKNVLEILPAQKNFKYIKQHQSQFNDFCMVFPLGTHLMALTHKHVINCYKVATGELMSTLKLEGQALTIVENPKFPYAAVGFENGEVKLISAYSPEKLTNMTQFFLTKHPINSICFNECGTVFVVANLTIGRFFIVEGLPSGQMEIIANFDTHRQIVDQMMIVSQDCYRIFMIPVTSSSLIAGNVILRYCIIKNKGIDIKQYSLEETNLMGKRIVPTSGTGRDRLLYIIPYDGKMIHEVEIKKGEKIAKLIRKIVTGHQMQDFHLKLDQKNALTWGFDGLIITRGSNFARNVGICLPHHRMEGGVKKAQIDPQEKCIISLGRDCVLACTNLKETQMNPKLVQDLEDIHYSEDYRLLFTRRTLGFLPKGQYEGKCYLEVQEMRKIEEDRTLCETERKRILDEFKIVQKEVQQLLTANIAGPDNEKLNLSEFDMHTKLHDDKAAHHKKLRKAMEVYLKQLIEAQNKVSNYMMMNYWDKMKVPGTSIKGIFVRFEVNNYVLRPPNVDREFILEWIRYQRRLENYLSALNSFHPWEPIPEQELMRLISQPPTLPIKDEHLAVLSAVEFDAPEIEEPEENFETKIAFSGSDLGRFIEIQDVHYLQNELQTYVQTELQWIISKSDSYKIKEFFNANFDKMMAQKVKEMENIQQKNDRLRHIVSELNYFSEEQINMVIEDPEWKQIESPELIIQVKDDEVPITPYISPSQQAILDAKATEAERLRLLLLADDFREKALIKMMNGVLEVRWEDELRKEVPLPKCMIEKEPENFNEDDIRIVREYEEKVQFLHSERERYKTLLRVEYAKLAHFVRDNIKKFNAKLSYLLNLKLQVDAAISHESLKINRMKMFQYKRKEMIRREQQTLEKILHNEEVISSLQKLMHTLHDAVSECRNYVDSFQTKDKFLDRSYRKDFQDMSIVIQEQASKLFRKRPKINFRSINSHTLLNELAKCILSNAKPSLALNADCMEFLKQLENLDMYVGVPAVVDEHTYALICKHRRLRIEYEIRIKAAQTELAEAEATLAAFHKTLQQKKEFNAKLHNDLNELRQELITIICDNDIQIVLPRGLVEVPLTGSLEDFKDVVLVCRKDVEDINRIILEFGGKKIKALQQGMNFHRKILASEWEHKRMRMLIQDLQEKIVDIDGVRLTKEIQFYLKTKDKERTIPFETEVDMIKGSYENTIQDRKDKVHKMKKQIKTIKEHDKHIERKVLELNVDVCEFNILKDHELNQKERNFIDTRMRTLLKRSRLVQQIQDNHHEILMLQTELEILRLKTFPTLKYKEV